MYVHSLVLFNQVPNKEVSVSSSSVNEPTDGVSSVTAQSGATEQTKVGFVRSIGLPTAIAINMTQMCGIGPFITIPLMVAAFGGPQAILGWIVWDSPRIGSTSGFTSFCACSSVIISDYVGD